MSDYMPVEVLIGILKTLQVKSLVRFRSVSKTWNTLISNPFFISTHLRASLSGPPNNSFLLFSGRKNGRESYSLHYDNDGFDEFKQLQFPLFGSMSESCNGLICIQKHGDHNSANNFVLWNPSIQKFIYLPQACDCETCSLNIGFGIDSRTNDYKILYVGIKGVEDYSLMFYLFSLNEYRWKRVTAIPPNYTFYHSSSVPFVNGAVHLLGHLEGNYDEYSHAILGFDLSAEEFFKICLPESLIGCCSLDILKYGESSIAVYKDPIGEELLELWVMKEYGVVESWTKVWTLQRAPFSLIPKVLGFRKNGEILLHMDNEKIASLDLNSQPIEAAIDLNSQQIELRLVDVWSCLSSVKSYSESLVFLDKANVYNESYYEDENHLLDSSDMVQVFETCTQFLSTTAESDSDEDENEFEEDENEDGSKDSEEFNFFLRLFTENNGLRSYYKTNCRDGDFCCLVCCGIRKKAWRTFKGCVGLIQHSTAISKTKRKGAHRAFGQVICKVLNWDIDHLPSIMLKSELQSHSLEDSTQGLDSSQITTNEWPCTEPVDDSTSTTLEWPSFSTTPVTHMLSAEEQRIINMVQFQQNVFEACTQFLSTTTESDSDEDDNEFDEDGLMDEDGSKDSEEFNFFLRLFTENNGLRSYYETNCRDGDFFCLVCRGIREKGWRTFKDCVGLIQHSTAISKTKQKRAHRAFGQVICKVLNWDIDHLPSNILKSEPPSHSPELSQFQNDGKADSEPSSKEDSDVHQNNNMPMSSENTLNTEPCN